MRNARTMIQGGKVGRGPLAARGGFILLEALLATAIFAVAILALARSVDAGLQSGIVLREDARASRALLNWMRELQAGSQPYADIPTATELRGEFTGMRLRQSVVPMELVDLNDLKVDGMLEVTLEVSWNRGGIPGSKQLKFYAYPTGN